MERESQLQRELLAAFPQFGEKSRLIDYFMSFDFPERQMKMVGWWTRVLEFLIARQPRTYLTYQELTALVSLHNLKPTPLPALLNYLAARDVFVPQGELRAKAEKEREKQGKSWFASLLPFLGKEKERPAFSCGLGEKIFSKKAKEFKKQEARAVLPVVFGHGQSLADFRLAQLLQERLQLDECSVHELLDELVLEGVIAVRSRGLKTLVLYSPNAKDLLSNDWGELEAMKFCLREEIGKFEGMAAREQQRAVGLRAKAGEQALAGNRAGAKATLREYLQRERKAAAIGTRKNVLEGQLTQLEYNEMNKSTLLLLEESQKVYQQTLIDQARLDDAIDKTIDQQQQARETNEKLDQLAQGQGEEEDVESMLEALSQEVSAERVEGRKARVELQGEGEREREKGEREKEERMEVELQ